MLNYSISSVKAIFSGKAGNEKLKLHLQQAFPFWMASLITGVVAVLYAKLFAWAEKLSATIIGQTGWMLFILTPLCFVLAWWLVKQFARSARGSGIPQVMAAIELATPRHNHRVEKLLSIRTAIVKIISSVLMTLGGGAIGREGPTIQIAGSIFWKVNQLLPKSWPRVSKRNMIITGAAAGLAAAFNTPLGGIVFAVEELAKTHIARFRTAIFTAVIIAGLTAQAISGPYLYLGYPDVSNLSGYIFLYVIVVAILCGFLGTLMSKIIIRILKWKANIKMKGFELLYVILAGLGFAAVAYFFSHDILGSGKEQMQHILFTADKYPGWQMAIWRIAGPIVSFTTGGAGGVFAPALGAGAVIGGCVSEISHLSGANANIMALAGMVAFLTGITRSPFTSAILVLEMTDRHNVIFQLMLAGMVSSLVAGMMQKESFYEQLEESYLEEAHKGDGE